MRRLLGHEEDGLELGLALGVEVGKGEKIEVILGDALAEIVALLFGHVLLGSQPERLLCFDLLPLTHRLLRWLLLLSLILLLFRGYPSPTSSRDDSRPPEWALDSSSSLDVPHRVPGHIDHNESLSGAEILSIFSLRTLILRILQTPVAGVPGLHPH